MAYTYKPNLVSLYANSPRSHHLEYERPYYRQETFKAFVTAVCEALGGASYHNVDYSSAVIYHPGEVHARGIVGYKDVRVKGGGTSDPKFYVQAMGIANDNYRNSIWQHSILSTKTMKSGVKLAVEHLKPIEPHKSFALTAEVARRVISESIGDANAEARKFFRMLTGESSYGNAFTTEFFRELRNVTFVSQEVNQNMTSFFAAVDKWNESKAIAERGLQYVAFMDNYGQLVADTADTAVGGGNNYLTAGDFTRIPAEALPEWVQGRIAVLQLVEPETYVQGVGLRLDDKVYYISKEGVEE